MFYKTQPFKTQKFQPKRSENAVPKRGQNAVFLNAKRGKTLQRAEPYKTTENPSMRSKALQNAASCCERLQRLLRACRHTLKTLADPRAPAADAGALDVFVNILTGDPGKTAAGLATTGEAVTGHSP